MQRAIGSVPLRRGGQAVRCAYQTPLPPSGNDIGLLPTARPNQRRYNGQPRNVQRSGTTTRLLLPSHFAHPQPHLFMAPVSEDGTETAL